MNYRAWIVVLAVLAIGLLLACPADVEPEAYPVDADEVAETVDRDMRAHRAAAQASMGWVEDTRIWQTSSLPAVTAFDDDNERQFESLLTLLNDYVLVPDNLEEQRFRAVVYRLDGQRICDGLRAEFGDTAAAIGEMNGLDNLSTLADLIALVPLGPANSLAFIRVIEEFFAMDSPPDSSLAFDDAAPPPTSLDPTGDDDRALEDRTLEDRTLEDRTLEDRTLDDSNSTAGDESTDFDHDQCMQTIDRAQLRVRVTAPAPDAYHLALLVGESQHTPVTYRLSPSDAQWHMDVEATGNAWASVRDAMGSDQASTIPDHMAGRFQQSFHIEGQAQTRSEWRITDPIRIESQPFDLRLETMDPFLIREADGDEQILASTIDIARIEIGFPIHDIDDEPRPARLGFDGISFESLLRGDQDDALEFTDMAIDQLLSLDIDESTVFTAEILRDDIPFDMTLRAAEQGSDLTLEPSPGLQITFQFGDLVDALGLPNWMRDNRITIEPGDEESIDPGIVGVEVDP